MSPSPPASSSARRGACGPKIGAGPLTGLLLLALALVGPLGLPPATSAHPTEGEFAYTRYKGSPTVLRIGFVFDGANLVLGEPKGPAPMNVSELWLHEHLNPRSWPSPVSVPASMLWVMRATIWRSGLCSL